MCHGHTVTRALDLPKGLEVQLSPWPRVAIVSAELNERPSSEELPDGADRWAVPRQEQWWAGRRALRAACTQVGITCTVVHTTSLGAPLVAGARVSVAHTLDIAVAAATTSWQRIGIDVERSDRTVDRLERRLSPEERGLVETGAVTTLGIFMAKEAASKAVGTGLDGSLERWPVTQTRTDEFAVLTEDANLRVRLYEFGDWLGAVAVGEG